MSDEQRAEVEAGFLDSARHGEPIDALSPSGRYRLTIQPYRTAPGAWAYTRGVVARVADGAVICDIKRNYSTFHHSFVEKDGREYLIGGRTYQTQTIVDLDRGVELTTSPDVTDRFCWARAYLSPDGNTLAVDGCYWACAYEYRFYDFSDLARGWPALPLPDEVVLEAPSAVSAPRWLDATTFEGHLCDHEGAAQERVRVERRGAAMAITERWVADRERARRVERTRLWAEVEAWWERFSTADPLFLRLESLLRRHGLPGPLRHSGVGRVVHHFRGDAPRFAVDFDWRIADDTIELQFYRAGQRAGHRRFAATPTGVDEAIAAVVAVRDAAAAATETQS